ncbi:MAG TPA: RimK family alpha-L-glutamate ligase [Candidatus Aenigmarchaeota archaeon]|nr:MAG: hypothetical protein DRP03_02535 [Candidatus Aenigmarchaeota archaeon]HDD45998.1 RimK family alpha-L-glutamate ligase [Candidatus Aenigmarchaeota archaeon]
MRIGILGAGIDNIGYSTKRLLEEAKKEFKNAELIPCYEVKLFVGKELRARYGKRDLTDYDYVILRIDSKRAQTGYPVVRFMDDMNIKKQYPAETIIIAHNKFITLQELVKHNIPVPDTYLVGSRNTAMEMVDKLKFPLVMKLLSSFGGQGVMIIDSKEAAKSVIAAMKVLKQELLIEKFVRSEGEDIRGVVAGDEVIASFKRIAKPGELKSNIHAGGRGVVFKLTDEMEDICIRAAQAIKAKICAIDMLQGKDGIKVIEANINPGLQGIEKATGINVAKRIIEFVKSEVKA